MLTVQAIFSSGRHVYPSPGVFVPPPDLPKTFKQNEIPNSFKPFRLRPLGMRDGSAEYDILGRIKAIAQGRTRMGDVTNR